MPFRKERLVCHMYKHPVEEVAMMSLLGLYEKERLV